MKTTFYRVLLLLALASLLAGQGRLAAQDVSTAPSVHYPAPMQAWETEVALGLRLLTVPREIAEEEINKAPSIEVITVTGLPWQFAVRSGAVLQFVTNHFSLGAVWSFRLGDVSVGIGADPDPLRPAELYRVRDELVHGLIVDRGQFTIIVRIKFLLQKRQVPACHPASRFTPRYEKTGPGATR